MFTSTAWEYHGDYYDFPARNVIPKPLQQPHPPLWVACSNIQTIAQAGQWGLGALGFSFVSPDAAKAWVHRYYNMLLKHPARLAAYPDNPNIACVAGFMCAETDEEAQDKASGWTFFVFALSHYGRKGIEAPGTGDLWKAYQEWRGSEQEKKALASGLIGSPATIREKLHQFEEAGIDQVILLNQAGRTSHDDICDSLKLFAEEVMPEFHGRQAEHEAWKADVLAGRIELEDLSTEPYDLYAHQNEDIVRLTPEELKRRMAEKEAAAGKG
jgi:alkanesulfonate monooxygenase SsuD/methylene tetrahydromethanopterin reductase-like flavin-dependent oxidoreductase (luciferase family)